MPKAAELSTMKLTEQGGQSGVEVLQSQFFVTAVHHLFVPEANIRFVTLMTIQKRKGGALYLLTIPSKGSKKREASSNFYHHLSTVLLKYNSYILYFSFLKCAIHRFLLYLELYDYCNQFKVFLSSQKGNSCAYQQSHPSPSGSLK